MPISGLCSNDGSTDESDKDAREELDTGPIWEHREGGPSEEETLDDVVEASERHRKMFLMHLTISSES